MNDEGELILLRNGSNVENNKVEQEDGKLQDSKKNIDNREKSESI